MKIFLIIYYCIGLVFFFHDWLEHKVSIRVLITNFFVQTFLWPLCILLFVFVKITSGMSWRETIRQNGIEVKRFSKDV